ncbi:HIT domain-containing protein [Oceanospirillum beijerinckii]|uniref:HIT domain-containing protein n=1 Tax=Oceanospirillum beijerinckii TaxID=64976 RepID=UPI0004093865|nr:HIT domain-containing protein [Oceanospirillum beijerinckii]
MFTLHTRLEEDTFPVADLPLCRLCMMNDRRFPWFILIPRIGGITEIYQLEADDRQQLMNESCALAEALMVAFDGHKMNVAALGNMVPQLHIHHVVRQPDDSAWPAPIWGGGAPEAMEPELIEQRMAQLLYHLEVKIPNLVKV